MYENVTFEGIMQGMLNRIPDSFDKREGSLIYDALAQPAELQIAYIELDNVLNEAFADTASREYLVKRAAERGMTPHPATAAELLGELKGADVPISTRFLLDELHYVVTEKKDDTHYKLQCETPGTAGNRYFGTLTPVDYVRGLESASLLELLVPGEDEEDTETFRHRYLNSLSAAAFGGNIADYKEKVGAIAGVGGVKVYPVWTGPGTVKVVFTDSQNSVPTAELVQEVQMQIDPEQNHGEGLGLAPIGHTVTVQGAASFAVTVSAAITCTQGHAWADISPSVSTAAAAYLAALAAKWPDGNLIVRVSQMESCLLNVNGVLDVENLMLNGSAANLPVQDDKIPTLGAVTNANSTA